MPGHRPRAIAPDSMGTVVIGAGSRGTALAMQLARASDGVHLRSRDAATSDRIRETRRNGEMARAHGIDMPITAEMHRLPFEGKSPREAMIDLMTRSLKAEF
ncbi:MAG: hypothetical protein ACKPBU_08495 [Alphaproteobacteria bacterium]